MCLDVMQQTQRKSIQDQYDCTWCSGSGSMKYHDVPSGRRLAMGLAYLGLAAALWLTLPLGASAVPSP